MIERVNNLRKRFLAALSILGLVGCSAPESQSIGIETSAAEAGLSSDDYTIHDDGIIKFDALEGLEAREADTAASNLPLAATGEDWEYIVNNGIRTADEYAVKNNPASTFAGNNVQKSLDKQYGGEYEGEYLLTLINDNKGSISYAQLRPLFDINEPSAELDDESELWSVVTAKYNGHSF